MLGLEMDIEADLGIDSIKRVEILSALEEKIPGLPAVAPEDMGRLKTLAQIIAHLAGPGVSTRAGDALPVEAPAAAPATQARADGAAPRRTVVFAEAPPAGAARPLAPAAGRTVVVTEEPSGLSRAIVASLAEMGLDAVLVSNAALAGGQALPAAACGLVIVQDPASPAVEADLMHAFELARRLGPELQESARLGGAFFATVTRLDGALGFRGAGLANPVQGALAGLAKTAAVEWPEVRCHAIDVAPDWDDHDAVAKALAAEFMGSTAVEIGLERGRRVTPRLTDAPCSAGDIHLAPQDVVVVSGGARGITAACAVALAGRTRATLVLLGRSPQPVPEPEWMRDLAGEAGVKKALLEREFSRAAATPADVERRLKELMANREVARTISAIEAAGSAARYYAVDVRDAERVSEVLADARARCGPIRGIIHAAGILEDRLIVDKSAEQFRRVFETKVTGFQSLLAAAAQDDLAYIVAFSSVTARIGNRGQADYAMANEALNKMAAAESVRRPGCRVISVNWGPWNGGMVTAGLKREFERQGVALLEPAEGAAALLREMGRRGPEPVEVVIGGILQPAAAATAPAAPVKPNLVVLFEREIDLQAYPILESHRIDGRAVVPLALIAEWFGHGALHENPGLLLHGLEDVHILNGIRLGEQSKLIRLLAGKPQRRNGFFEVDLELRNGVREGKDILHCRARAILAEDAVQPPAYLLPASLIECNHYPRSVAEIYTRILFHGRRLHGLKAVQCCTAEGMVAEVAGAPSPDRWMVAPLRNRWLCDPLALDSAFQMASLWCYEQRGCVSLPSRAASYRQYRLAFPADGVTVVLEVRQATEKKMRGDFIFLDAGREVVATLNGYEAVMDPLLNRAFKPGAEPPAPLTRESA
jgi:NAD(P)-dependent dehydrogenase (short-subunit alcohol dehydrogenase family)